MGSVEVLDLDTRLARVETAACPGAQPPERPESLTGWRRRAFLTGVFVVSLSVLTFEIALTRLFAAVLVYHFVFVAVSIGLLGLGLGGVLLAWLPREVDGEAALRRMGLLAVGEAAALVLTLAIFLRYPNADRLLPFALAALPPFSSPASSWPWPSDDLPPPEAGCTSRI